MSVLIINNLTIHPEPNHSNVCRVSVLITKNLTIHSEPNFSNVCRVSVLITNNLTIPHVQIGVDALRAFWYVPSDVSWFVRQPFTYGCGSSGAVYSQLLHSVLL